MDAIQPMSHSSPKPQQVPNEKLELPFLVLRHSEISPDPIQGKSQSPLSNSSMPQLDFLQKSQYIDISGPNGFQVAYTGKGTLRPNPGSSSVAHNLNEGEIGSVRTILPLEKLPNSQISYFEVEISGPECGICIGFCSSSVQIDRLPGSETNSYGFYGKTCHLFRNGAQPTKFTPQPQEISIYSLNNSDSPISPFFGDGDVVGCGIDYHQKTIFYTKNGQFLGQPFKNINLSTSKDIGKVHIPSISASEPISEFTKYAFGKSIPTVSNLLPIVSFHTKKASIKFNFGRKIENPNDSPVRSPPATRRRLVESTSSPFSFKYDIQNHIDISRDQARKLIDQIDLKIPSHQLESFSEQLILDYLLSTGKKKTYNLLCQVLKPKFDQQNTYDASTNSLYSLAQKFLIHQNDPRIETLSDRHTLSQQILGASPIPICYSYLVTKFPSLLLESNVAETPLLLSAQESQLIITDQHRLEALFRLEHFLELIPYAEKFPEAIQSLRVPSLTLFISPDPLIRSSESNWFTNPIPDSLLLPLKSQKNDIEWNLQSFSHLGQYIDQQIRFTIKFATRLLMYDWTLIPAEFHWLFAKSSRRTSLNFLVQTLINNFVCNSGTGYTGTLAHLVALSSLLDSHVHFGGPKTLQESFDISNSNPITTTTCVNNENPSPPPPSSKQSASLHTLRGPAEFLPGFWP